MTGRRTAGALAGCSFILLSGCAAPDLVMFPKSRPGMLGRSAPTVADLVDHVACEVARSYVRNTGPTQASEPVRDRWVHLIDDNFFASVDLELSVQRTANVAPTFGHVTPLDALGHAAPLTSSVSSSSNRTLAIGVDLERTADYTVSEKYVLGVKDVVVQYLEWGRSKKHPEEGSPGFPVCSRVGTAPQSDQGAASEPLVGNMQLEETIEDGLVALDRSGSYNLGALSAPAPAGLDLHRPSPVDTEALAPLPSNSQRQPEQPGPTGQPAQAKPSRLAPFADMPRLLQLFSLPGVLTPTLPTRPPEFYAPLEPGPAPTFGSTTFGSSVDFVLLSAVGAGPSYTIATRKWGGSTIATGATGQLLGFNRTTTDKLIVTFGATCRDELREMDIGPTSMTVVPKVDGKHAVTIDVTGTPSKGHGSSADFSSFSLSLTFDSDPAPRPLEKGTGKLVYKSIGEPPKSSSADVTWTGFVPVDGGPLEIRGIVSSRFGDSLGQVWLKGQVQPGPVARTVLIEGYYIPVGVATMLDGSARVSDYWGSLPRCDVATAAQVRSSIDSIGAQNDVRVLRSP